MFRCLAVVGAYLILGGCSFFQTHEYATCEVTWSCESCEEVEVRVFGESASGEDSKEVEVPAL